MRSNEVTPLLTVQAMEQAARDCFDSLIVDGLVQRALEQVVEMMKAGMVDRLVRESMERIAAEGLTPKFRVVFE